MLKRILHACLLVLPIQGLGQYYLTGKVVDDKNKPIPMVKLRLQSNGILFQSGSTGEFGIPSSKRIDSITCITTGFDTLKVELRSGNYATVIMKVTDRFKNGHYSGLSSLTHGLWKDPAYRKYVFDETYSSMIENDLVDADKYPRTGFALNVNKASYSNIRRFIANKTFIPTDAVRIEEMLNYFSLSCTPPPTGKDIFNIETRVGACPWNMESLLLFINIQARQMSLDNVPPSNLVFLIDDSGSMDAPNRLPLLKIAFRMLVNNLREKDTVTLITYGGTSGIILEPTSGIEKQKIITAIEELTAGGSTPGSSGLKMAYESAKKSFIKNGNNRVILATDGDFNVGETNENELEELIVRYKNTGIYLTCLGVGMGNYKDSKLEVLARYGNGNFSYLDNEAEAEKLLVKEFTQTVVTIASDVYLNINFDAQKVDKYRLIGFDNKIEAITDSTSILEGGDIGCGHSLLAILEFIPHKKEKIELLNATGNSIADLELQYKPVNKKEVERLNNKVSLNYASFSELDKRLQFATSVAMYGQILKDSKFTEDIPFDDVINIATNAANMNDPIQKDYLKLLQDTKTLYVKELKKRSKRRK